VSSLRRRGQGRSGLVRFPSRRLRGPQGGLEEAIASRLGGAGLGRLSLEVLSREFGF